VNVLFTGYHNPHYPTVTEYIEEAIRSLGHALRVIDEGCHILPGRLRQRSSFIERIDLQWFNRHILEACDRFRPDLFIALGGERVLPSTVSALKKRGTRTILWTVDPPVHFSPVLCGAPAYDHVFCQGTEAVDILRQRGIKRLTWLPMACAPAHHYRVDPGQEGRAELSHDVVFVGSHYPVRERFLEGLADLDLSIWGPGWDRLRKDSPLKCCVRAAHTPPELWRKIYAAAKIVLSVHFSDPHGVIPCHQASPRVFEAMACGAFVISDRQRDVLALFREGEHLATAGNPAELRERVLHYLERPGERERMARSGREEVLRRHTYARRIRILLDEVGLGARGAQETAEAVDGAG